MNPKKPNFLVVGAAKCGTTNLFNSLIQHPDIFIPEIKECRYFSQIKQKRKNPYNGKNSIYTDVIDSAEKYYSLFENTEEYKARGDISNDYLYYFQNSVEQIKRELGNEIKIIIILRNPVERAFSQYLHFIREEETSATFEEMLKNEEQWYNTDTWWCFFLKDVGLYYEGVKTYMEKFPHIKIFIFEEFIKNQDAFFKEICNFFEIDNTFKFQEPEFRNKTGMPKNKMLNHILMGNVPFRKTFKKLALLFWSEKKIINKIHKRRDKNLYKPNMEDSTRKYLSDFYSREISKLEKLLDRDLSLWK